MIARDQPEIGGICDTCGHFALRHDEGGCHGLGRYLGCRYGKGGQPCSVMRWAGNDWPRPWLPAPDGLTARDKEPVPVIPFGDL